MEYLGQTIRIHISDGRVIEGEFQCMDKDLNFVLGNSVEYYDIKAEDISRELPADDVPSRQLGAAMVPGTHVLSVLGKPIPSVEVKKEGETKEKALDTTTTTV